MSQGVRSRRGAKLVQRGTYYQTICRHFLQHRGAPLILSSREIELIAEWERTEIPLSAVLEGMQRAFENRPVKSGRQPKTFSLNQCRVFVQDAYKQHRERHVGRAAGSPSRAEKDKRKRILSEVEGFLSSSSCRRDLRNLFLKLHADLKRGRWDEKSLEKAEGAVEDILIAQATSEERERIESETDAEFGAKEGLEFDRIVRLKLIKELRSKYKVPYISPFYY